MSSIPHVEVIPRIIDSSIAASYQPIQSNPEPVQEPVIVSPVSTHNKTITQRFFACLIDYSIPILFIIAVIIVIYIIYKYWTSHKESNSNNPPAVLNEASIGKEDLSKYLSTEDSDEEADEEDIEDDNDDEDDEDESNDSEEESDDEESDDEESDGEEQLNIVEPDLKAIESLINQSLETYPEFSLNIHTTENISLCAEDNESETSNRFELLDETQDVPILESHDDHLHDDIDEYSNEELSPEPEPEPTPLVEAIPVKITKRPKKPKRVI